MSPEDIKAARELLAFYVEAGVDSLVEDEPVNRLAPDPREAGVAAPGPPPSAPSVGRRALNLPDRLAPAPASQRPVALPLPGEGAAANAREAARSARSLDELRAILQSFDGCTLKSMATRLVFADGNPQAKLMLVGEAPGREEDIEGLPFVGRSGQLLDRMLAAIGLDRRHAYIANVIPWRPPGNRTPTPQETEICLPFVRRQIELADPDVLVCLGGPSMQALLGVKEGIMKTRGRWFAYDTGSREIRAMPTLHPAYLLRQPLAKRLAWRDFLAIKTALSG